MFGKHDGEQTVTVTTPHPQKLRQRATADAATGYNKLHIDRRSTVDSMLMQCISYPAKLKCQIVKRRACHFVDVSTTNWSKSNNTWNDRLSNSFWRKKHRSLQHEAPLARGNIDYQGYEQSQWWKLENEVEKSAANVTRSTGNTHRSLHTPAQLPLHKKQP